MVRFMHCVKAKAGVSEIDFREAFSGSKMQDFVRQGVELTGAVSHKLCLTLKIEVNTGLMEERGGEEPFDGVLEMWWESGSSLLDLKESDAFKKLQEEMTAYQSEFVDFSRSSRFFIED